ncbi:MAG: SprT-like domain-containing protein [Bdellovibrionales bacterium]|nr:SprT-like domain-containing protein [Bdellovibrionales bacterium]
MQLSLFNCFRNFRKQKTKRPASNPRKSDRELYALWLRIRMEYFPSRSDLDAYRVYWSTRNQKRTLASCNIEDKRVVVARELNYPEHHQWLEPLLYHEMCHAYFGIHVPRKNGKYSWHGREFKQLEARHPQLRAFDHWVHSGGWARAVRSDRARQAHSRRKLQAA